MMYHSNVVKNWKSLKTENPETETKHYLHCLWLCIYFPKYINYSMYYLYSDLSIWHLAETKTVLISVL